jgi:hypothetical protein
VNAASTVFDYERNMALDLFDIMNGSAFQTFERTLKNAVVESLVLHTRILCDILTSKSSRDDDITLRKLLPAFTSPHVDELKAAYGNSSAVDTPCWTFNKMLAHPTTHRSHTYNYASALNSIWPTMLSLLTQIDAVSNPADSNAPGADECPLP